MPDTWTPTARSTITARDRTDSGVHRWVALALFVVVAQLAGLVGLPFTDTDPGSWYDQLDTPWFTPPGWVFGPMWTTLYALIGVAAWRVWGHHRSRDRSRALGAWGLQLAVNAVWTPVFFGAEQPWGGLVVITTLVVLVVITIALMARVDRAAAALMLPYLAWISFATLLNGAIALAN